MEQVTVLGSTGSIGVNTLDVIGRHPQRYGVYALTANTNIEKLQQQCLQFQPQYAVVVSEHHARELAQQLAAAGCSTEVIAGAQGLEQVASATAVDSVMAAIVGAAGLPASLAAAQAGKKVLLANKEALVMAGPLFMQAVQQGGASLLPIDSEHNAIFQCLPAPRQQRVGGSGEHSAGEGVRRILLTGSGGPFRELPADALATVTPQQACAHPNWDMGQKISVDSATMMNKGLELIEACWMFDCGPDDIQIVVHPQSVIHSMVEYVDGSILAQLGNPDMRTPIAYGLAWPERIDAGVASLDIIATARLDFEAPDEQRFPSLALARQAFLAGGTAPAILSAANEVAVEAFLQSALPFNRIADIVAETLGQSDVQASVSSLDEIYCADQHARTLAAELIRR